MTADQLALGEVIAQGSRSSIHRLGDAGVIAKVLNADVPANWLAEEARLHRLVTAETELAPAYVDYVPVGQKQALLIRFEEGPSLLELSSTSLLPVEVVDYLISAQFAVFGVTPTVRLPRQVDRLGAKLSRAKDHFETHWDYVVRLRHHLERLAAADPTVLCHGDLHPANVLVDQAGSKVPGGGVKIVDWFDASAGHSVVDIARTAQLLSPIAGTGLAPNLREKRRALGRLENDYLRTAIRRVSSLIGRDVSHRELHGWKLLQAYAQIAEFPQTEVADLVDSLGGLLRTWLPEVAQ